MPTHENIKSNISVWNERKLKVETGNLSHLYLSDFVCWNESAALEDEKGKDRYYPALKTEMTETGLRCQSLDDHERKDYIIIMENEDTAEEIVEEYAEVTTEDVQEAKEESAGDVQVVVSEMTGETAAEILDEEGVICVEEDMELEGLAEDRTRIEGQDGSASEGGG